MALQPRWRRCENGVWLCSVHLSDGRHHTRKRRLICGSSKLLLSLMMTKVSKNVGRYRSRDLTVITKFEQVDGYQPSGENG